MFVFCIFSVSFFLILRLELLKVFPLGAQSPGQFQGFENFACMVRHRALGAEFWLPEAYDLGSVNLGDGTEGSVLKCLAAPEIGSIIGEPNYKQNLVSLIHLQASGVGFKIWEMEGS